AVTVPDVGGRGAGGRGDDRDQRGPRRVSDVDTEQQGQHRDHHDAAAKTGQRPEKSCRDRAEPDDRGELENVHRTKPPLDRAAPRAPSAAFTRSAVSTPDAHAPWIEPYIVDGHASPAKNTRSAIGSPRIVRHRAKPGRAAEYDPRAQGSPSHAVALVHRILSRKPLPKRSASSSRAADSR